MSEVHKLQLFVGGDYLFRQPIEKYQFQSHQSFDLEQVFLVIDGKKYTLKKVIE